jgi:Resolvase, N terminal domain
VAADCYWLSEQWGRSVTDLLTTLQELEHLGVGFVSLTEALDLTTPAGRAMAGLLAVFAEFEREILRERVRALVWLMPGRMASAWVGQLRQRCTPIGSVNSTAPDSANRPSPAACTSGAPRCAVS